MSHLMNIRLVGAELFHVDGQTERHGEANIRFSQLCERAWKSADKFQIWLKSQRCRAIYMKP
jgi:hypothetical protein